MITYNRRQSLLEQLRKQPGLRVWQLAEFLGVSEGTVRNDLNALELDGHLRRVHGGSILNDPGVINHLSFAACCQEYSASKPMIAQFASELVRDGDSIFLDASNSSYFLAQAIQTRSRLRVVTIGLDVAQLLAKNPSNTVILIGGIVNRDGSSVVGLFSEKIIRELHIQKAFVSSSGFSLERGLTEVDIHEAQIKRIAIGVAQEVIVLIESCKIDKDELTPFARIEQINRVITDAGVSPMWVQLIEQAGILLTICRETS